MTTDIRVTLDEKESKAIINCTSTMREFLLKNTRCDMDHPMICFSLNGYFCSVCVREEKLWFCSADDPILKFRIYDEKESYESDGKIMDVPEIVNLKTVNIELYVKSKESISNYLKFMKMNLFCDVVILVDDKEYKCSKFLLATNFKYFDNVFLKDRDADVKEEKVTVTFCTWQIFETIIEYIELGIINYGTRSGKDLILFMVNFIKTINLLGTKFINYDEIMLNFHNCLNVENVEYCYDLVNEEGFPFPYMCDKYIMNMGSSISDSLFLKVFKKFDEGKVQLLKSMLHIK